MVQRHFLGPHPFQSVVARILLKVKPGSEMPLEVAAAVLLFSSGCYSYQCCRHFFAELWEASCGFRFTAADSLGGR